MIIKLRFKMSAVGKQESSKQRKQYEGCSVLKEVQASVLEYCVRMTKAQDKRVQRGRQGPHQDMPSRPLCHHSKTQNVIL